MKASDLIALKIAEYTDYVFSGQGGSVVHILDSIYKRKDLKLIPSQNEQGASLAADAYSRTSGKLGIVVTTSGPGTLNGLQGLACSYYDSVPALYFSGAPVLGALKKSSKLRQLGFQEMEIQEVVKSFTKYSTRIIDVKKIFYEIDKCIFLAKSGRPGPCLIDLPDDIQRMETSIEEQEKFNPEYIKLNLKSNQVEEACKMIASSKRPIFVIGHGVKIAEAEKDINELLKKTNIPYAPTWATIDMFKTDDPKNIGTFGVYATRYGNFSIQNSDLLIVLGSRLNTSLIGSNPKLFAPNAKKILVDIDQAELEEENGLAINLKINCDVKDFIKELNKKKPKWNFNRDWGDKIQSFKKKYPIIKEDYFNQKNTVNPYIFFNTLADYTSEDDIIIPDASSNLVWTYQAYKVTKRQKIFTALNHSPMGYSVAAAIGASLGSPKKNVIAIIGDGSMQMNIQELENIKSLKLPIKIFLINNKGYGMVKQTIDTWLDSKYVGCDEKSGLSLPDFQKVTNSYGIDCTEIDNHNDLKEKIEYTLNFKGPMLCDVKLDPNEQIVPKVKAGSPIHEMIPALDSAEVALNMKHKN
ncbi:thiamine pyrophosphate-binding protein [bacterium]|nr:thiamine pyrophosphate-binding protein [bacterium]